MFSNIGIFLLPAVFLKIVSPYSIPSCDSHIYCQGELLDTVQRAKIFPDSKTFVDQRMLYDESVIFENFQQLMNTSDNRPSRDQIRTFVQSNFAEGNELQNWTLPDYDPNPPFLQKVNNSTLRYLATEIVKIWPTLARKIKADIIQDSSRYSIIPVPNPFVVPGGRFKESYYWDSFWIVEGLLISGMTQTAQGMIENFLYIVDKYGFIPNGLRVYYLNRSHPPLLTSMVTLLMNYTNDLEWLRRNIHLLDKELEFFLSNRTFQVSYKWKTHTMFHYDSESGSPRPESYIEDVETCATLKEATHIEECYKEMKSTAESGWDFTYRWVFDDNGGNNANRTYTQCRRIIPVDLNSMLAKAMRELKNLHLLLGDTDKYFYWQQKYDDLEEAINDVLYHKGIWFDYDVKFRIHRKYFYPSNLAPLWAEINGPVSTEELGKNAYSYLISSGITSYLGGIPNSLNNTGEQWDFPMAWAPSQSIVIQGLRRSGQKDAQQLAKTLAGRWLMSNLMAYKRTGEMYEKYDAVHPGQAGGGGEYSVQTGFGWTNGVALEFIVDFFSL
ncbi:trehalase-like [Coccinella septempunctata]|uniref:trehalase-like n=1 Tax=Coccinella septempunctata TaxID=41139 RepID=UPI001D09740B|nr:trehalase-like [Coccinella septempunctata]XP_044759540.1 trehalase-like [Coccinella septempunctata]